MTTPGGPGRRGRHSAGDGTGGFPSLPWTAGPTAPPGVPPLPGGSHRGDDRTGPLPEPEWWSYGSTAHPDHPRARHAGGDDEPARPADGPGPQHPSAPLPPLPTGGWGRLQPRTDGPADDDATVAQRYDPPADPDADAAHHGGPDEQHGHPADGDTDSWDRTGGLEVIGTHDDARHHDGHDHDDHDGNDHDGNGRGGATAVAAPKRRRRRPVAVLLSLLVLGGLVVGIVLGVQALLGLTEAEDYTGEGTGTVEIRVTQGDTLSDIARTLAEADVIASTRPFVNAAEGRPEATGIQPGVYGLRSQMSGQAALDLLLGEGSRLVTRVTIPEGLTVARVLERVATETGRPIEELQAAAADGAALGLPAYANGQLEGYLFPATYDVDPDQTPADVLRAMVQQFTKVAGSLQLEARAAALGRTPAEIVTVASMIQSETRLDEERPDVAQVIYNRLGQGIPLGIDATLAFGLGKSGNDLTVTDLRTDSPFNTRTRVGLPPTAISSPGEASLEAALAPSSGDLLYYVLESDEGAHFFTSDYAEFQAARQRCAEAGLGCGG
ncbi:UPF0755 protein [Blastococcus aggregatus]|uniref:Endolytic murein transglycosylase n=1 Tax=Blastococcus aggregatus TaxID=38502 RepID=A0A285V8Z0_9ACTN|nr:endolytic transglycosylase MltG [Blastococcus aggregatus]SOC50582.1 UPF0755 protein [Blastococcus aggregatus]